MKKLFGKLMSAASPAPVSPPQPIVVVSGLPRSGTSLMMKMLSAGGIPPLTDELRVADRDNPEGYYEFERVKQLDKGDTAWVEEADGKAVKVISFLLKHLPAGFPYQVVFVRRHMAEILASQRKMLVHRGEDPNKMDDAQMAAVFEKHLQQIDLWLRNQPNIELLYVHYSDIMSDPLVEITRLQRFLGRDLDAQGMLETVNPGLYRNRRPEAAAV